MNKYICQDWSTVCPISFYRLSALVKEFNMPLLAGGSNTSGTLLEQWLRCTCWSVAVNKDPASASCFVDILDLQCLRYKSVYLHATCFQNIVLSNFQPRKVTIAKQIWTL